MYGDLVPHEKHSSENIALVQPPPGAAALVSSSTGNLEEIPVSNSFILALLRRLRKLNSSVVEDEVRQLLKRAQQKNQEQSRDTEFATHVCVIEEELEREKLKRLLETVRSEEFQSIVRSEHFFSVGKDTDGRIIGNTENLRLFNSVGAVD
jgi:G3E family GTPase